MLGDEGEKISIVCSVCPHGLVSLLSLGYFFIFCSYYRPYHYYFPVYIGTIHIKY